MKHLYKVEFEIKYSGIGEWIGDHIVHVIANGDGMKAIAKASRLAKRHEFKDGDGSTRRAQKVRVVGLEQQQEIDG